VEVEAGRLFEEALTKETDGLPLVVAIDVNLPPSSRSWQEWMEQVQRNLLDRLGTPTPDSPDPFDVLVLTNYAWHWTGDDVAPVGQSMCVMSQHSSAAVTANSRVQLVPAFRDYGRLPNAE
jgi:hypothetical protein